MAYEKQQCGHDVCTCLADGATLYCSDACRQSADAEDNIGLTCNCGHEGCETETTTVVN